MVDFGAPMAPSARLALIQQAYPEWYIWFVPHALDGGATWCARRSPDDVHPLQADRASHLADMIEQELAERAEQDKAAEAFRPSPMTRIDHPGD